jgi:hypothetical protein
MRSQLRFRARFISQLFGLYIDFSAIPLFLNVVFASACKSQLEPLFFIHNKIMPYA